MYSISDELMPKLTGNPKIIDLFVKNVKNYKLLIDFSLTKESSKKLGIKRKLSILGCDIKFKKDDWVDDSTKLLISTIENDGGSNFLSERGFRINYIDGTHEEWFSKPAKMDIYDNTSFSSDSELGYEYQQNTHSFYNKLQLSRSIDYNELGIKSIKISYKDIFGNHWNKKINY